MTIRGKYKRTKKQRKESSERMKAKWHDDEYRQKMVDVHKGKKHTEETKEKMSESHKGNKRRLGTKQSEETKQKLSDMMSGEKHPLYGKKHTEATKKKMSETHLSLGLVGPEHARWIDGRSFDPYSSDFNEELKESIRNRDERKCFLCGKFEMLNAKKMTVHHIDGDKMNCEEENLVTLCVSCNSKPDTIEKEFLVVSRMG